MSRLALSATPVASAMPAVCSRCQSKLAGQGLFQRFGVCESCRWHAPISARRRLEQLVDPGSFRETGRRLATTDPLGFSDRLTYPERLTQARERTGGEESVVTGIGTIDGRAAVLAVSEFGFLGGSMGTVMGEKVALSFDLAAAKRLPLVAVTASGGARMQEGMLSLVQMATTAAAAARLKQAGLPFISVLTDPTTGGVYASYASLADIVLAEPKALVGFAGPRVFETLTGQAPAAGVQTAEFLAEHGWIDEVVDRTRLRNMLASLLQVLHDPGKPQNHRRGRRAPSRPPRRPERDAWATVQLARSSDRPTARYYLQRMMTQFFELRGDRHSGEDSAVVCGIGRLAGRSVLVVALERGDELDRGERRNGRASPAGYQKALRVMRLAGQLRLPLLTFIDTPGAWLDSETDARGLAPSIAACLATMSALPVPTIAAVIGEGGSGGALALGVADRILMQENAVYSVIGPEGAAAIVYRDVDHAPEVATSLKLTATDCRLLGVVDTVVPEPDGGAANDPDQAVLLLQNSVLEAFIELRKRSPDELVKERTRKFRQMGRRTIQVRRTRPTVRELQHLRLNATAWLPRLLRSRRSTIPDGGLAQG